MPRKSFPHQASVKIGPLPYAERGKVADAILVWATHYVIDYHQGGFEDFDMKVEFPYTGEDCEEVVLSSRFLDMVLQFKLTWS